MVMAYDRSYVDENGYEVRYQQHAHDGDEEVECAYCRMMVPGCEDCPNAPPSGDHEAWAELAALHDPECEWITTRAGRLDD
jgi:hypothetical protein